MQFQTAALVLEVTPHITSDGKIFMKMRIENNRPDFSQTVQGQPAIQIKEAETELLVADGDTTVIGGVFSTEEAESVNRVPLFGKSRSWAGCFPIKVEMCRATRCWCS